MKAVLLIGTLLLGQAAAAAAQRAERTPGRVAEPPLPPPSVSADSVKPAPPATRLQLFGRDVVAGFDGTLHTVMQPLRWSGRQWLVLPVAAGGLVALSRVDEPVHRLLDRNHSRAVDHALTTVEPFGTQYAIGTVVGTYVAGLALRQPALRRTGVEAAVSSVVAAGIVTPGLKLVVGRSRPWERRGAYTFHSLSGQESFPSGHTTQAFAVASVFAAEARPLPARVLIYALATGVASARLVHDAHFLTDVTAGAAIGTLTGRAVVRWEREHPGSWQPYVGRDGIGVRHPF